MPWRTRFRCLCAATLIVGACADDAMPPAHGGDSTTVAATTASGSTGAPPHDGETTGDTTGDDEATPTEGAESTSTGEPAACVEVREALEQLANQYAEASTLVGLSIAVSTDGCPPWTSASGEADVATGEPLTTEHLLRAGSITKPFTAALVLTLVDEGLLMLEDTVDQWEIDIPAGDQITLRMLLAHTSGLADYQNNPGFVDALQADPDGPWTPQELIAFTVALAPVGAPGQAHAYSNANYIVAALAVEAATGQSYAKALRSRVLGPAGLEHVWLEGEETWKEPMATGYLVSDGGPPLDSTGLYHASSVWSAGALVATASDLRLWITTLLTTDFLSARSQEALVQLVPDPAAGGYGLGVFRVDRGSVSAFGHNGAVMGFQAAAFYDPGTGSTVAVMHNQVGVESNGGLSGDPTVLALQLLEAVVAD